MEKQDVEIFNRVHDKINGISFKYQEEYVLAVISFDNQDFAKHLYRLLDIYKFSFIIRERNDYKCDLCFHFEDIEKVVVWVSEKNIIKSKSVRSLLNNSSRLKITAGKIFEDGRFIHLEPHLDVENLLYMPSKSQLN